MKMTPTNKANEEEANKMVTTAYNEVSKEEGDTDKTSQNSNQRSKRSFKFDSSLASSKSGSNTSSRNTPTKGPSGVIANSFKKFFSLFNAVWSYMKRIYTIPFAPEPVSFYRAEDFTTSGDRIYNINEQENEETLDMVEAACNYSYATRVLLDKIIEERIESALSKKQLSGSLDFSHLAPWNESTLDRLHSIFQIFDSSGDGLIDLEEMYSSLETDCSTTNTMIEFGDKSTAEDRRKIFTVADTLGKGALNFNEFLLMLHLIIIRSPDTVAPAVIDTFRLIDRNMARIRGLDVVQQLQTGLF